MRGQGATTKQRSTRQTCRLVIRNMTCLVRQVHMTSKKLDMYTYKCENMSRIPALSFRRNRTGSDTTDSRATQISNGSRLLCWNSSVYFRTEWLCTGTCLKYNHPIGLPSGLRGPSIAHALHSVIYDCFGFAPRVRNGCVPLV